MDVLEKKAEIEAMQAELRAEMDRIREKAEQAEEIERVKKTAQTYLNRDVMRVINMNNWIKKHKMGKKLRLRIGGSNIDPVKLTMQTLK